jgi:hypothetical protein
MGRPAQGANVTRLVCLSPEGLRDCFAGDITRAGWTVTTPCRGSANRLGSLARRVRERPARRRCYFDVAAIRHRARPVSLAKTLSDSLRSEIR